MTDILPFGSSESEATIDIGQQTFLGLTVVNFSVSSSWDPQGGQCSIELIQDTDQYLEQVVVGSPQYFEIETLSSEPVFRFYGILKEISRNVDPSSKRYTAVLQSPTLLLEACSIITDSYTGHGGAIEAYGANVPLCLDFGHLNSNINPANIFNIQNIYGLYENDSFGFFGAGFGKSYLTEEGIRADMFANALHELVNGNPNYTPALGSNIIYGVNAYSAGQAYAYNFDIQGFMAQIIDYIPSSYRVKSTNLLEFVNDICSQINFVYYVDLKKPQGSGKASFSGSTHETILTPTQTHSNTVYGGQIVIVVQNRNKISGIPFPLSAAIISNEVSDKLGGSGPNGSLPLDMGMTGSAHPSGAPVATSPYGGSFPVENITLGSGVKYSSTNLSVRLNESAVGAKYVVGGLQSRINYVSTAGINRGRSPEIAGSTCVSPSLQDSDSTADVYAYYGSINVSARIGQDVPNIPVLCELTRHGIPSIPIDVYDIFGNLTIPGFGVERGQNRNGPIINGIYFESPIGLAHALISYKKWFQYLSTGKTNIFECLNRYFGNIFSDGLRTYNSNGSLTPYGRSVKAKAHNIVNQFNTSADNTEKINNVNVYSVAFASRTLFLRRLYDRVKYIAETHYGKTYAVKCPAFATALDSNGNTVLNTFIRSWELSNDAYLEESNYGAYEAPSGPNFVSNGRLKSYAVYYAHTDSVNFGYWPGNNAPAKITSKKNGSPSATNAFTGREIFMSSLFEEIFGYELIATNVEPDFHQAITHNVLSFEYNRDEIFTTINYNQRAIKCVSVDVEQDYVFLPPIYFTYSSIAPIFPAFGQDLISNTPIQLNNRAYGFATLLRTLAIPYNGVGCIPFAIVTTKGCFESYPSDVNDAQNDEEVDGSSWAHLNAKDPADADLKIAIPPKAFGIAQQSNRYVYGPWITNTTLPYGCRIEYIQDSNLVPENYMIPTNISIGGITTVVNTGYGGMNAVGQLIANTVENFDFLFTEEASVSIPGYPIITHIGQSLVSGGPLVSDISISLTADTIMTQYSMKTFAPKFGRANKFVIDQLTRIGRNVNGK
jgi:hypothetical protein